MTRKLSFLIVATIASIILVTGCTSNSNDPIPFTPSLGVPEGEACTSDDKCEGDLICSSGLCSKAFIIMCTVDQGCSENQFCVEGECIDKPKDDPTPPTPPPPDPDPLPECSTDEDCADEKICDDGKCVVDDDNGDDNNDGSGPTCTPSCTGKLCGDDGCGGPCGFCPGGYQCDNSGKCQNDANDGSGPICQPNCSGKVCGDDGCGGSCGQCPPNHTCNGEAQCICMNTCMGKECGPDGCGGGGSCGICGFGMYCGEDSLCHPGCNPTCVGKQCGFDGCGGSCGECSTGYTCIVGRGKCKLDGGFSFGFFNFWLSQQGDVGDDCTSTTDCKSDLACQLGKCISTTDKKLLMINVIGYCVASESDGCADSDSGPAADANITILGKSDGSLISTGKTDSLGKFQAWVEAPKVCEIKVEKNGYDSKTTDKTVWDSLDSASMIIDLKKQPTFIDMHYMECTVPDELCGETTYICSPISRATEVKEYRCLDNDEYVAIKNILTWPAKKIERPKLEGQYYWLNKIRTIPGITLSVCNGDYDCMPGLICKRLFFDSSKPAVCMSNIYKEEEHDYIMSMEVQRRIADEMCSGMHPNGWAVPKYKHECDIGKSFGYSPNLDSLSTWQNWNKEFEFRCTSWTKIDFEEGLTTCAPAFCPYIPPPASPAGSTNIMFPKFKFNISKGTSEFLYGGCEVYSYGEEITQEFCTRTNAMELKMIPEYNLASLNAGVNNDTDKCDKYEGPMDSVNKLSDPTQHPSIYNPKFHYWWYWWQVRELDCYTDNNCPDDWGEHTTWKCEDNKCVEKIK